MTPLEILLSVRGLLASEARWTKVNDYQAVDGRGVSVWHPHACAFSLEGAFNRVAYITKSRSVTAARLILLSQIDPRGTATLHTYNSALGTTHYAVLWQLDSAIRSLGGTPPEQENE
jgi:hypothetical protein